MFSAFMSSFHLRGNVLARLPSHIFAPRNEGKSMTFQQPHWLGISQMVLVEIAATEYVWQVTGVRDPRGRQCIVLGDGCHHHNTKTNVNEIIADVPIVIRAIKPDSFQNPVTPIHLTTRTYAQTIAPPGMKNDSNIPTVRANL